MYVLSVLLTAAAAALGQTSGAQQDGGDRKSPQPFDAHGLPVPGQSAAAPSAGATLSAGATVDPKTYIIGPEDVLLVRVWREPDLSGPVAVRPDGKISMQLISDVHAAGLTPEKLTVEIAESLSKFMTKPEVSVSVQQVNSRKYYINGEVHRPGIYTLSTPTRVLEALANSGGFKEFANQKNIVIVRGTERLKFNYKEVVKGKKLEQNIFLAPGDQIIVP